MIDVDPPSSRRFWRDFTLQLVEALMDIKLVIVVPAAAFIAARPAIEKAIKEGWLAWYASDDTCESYVVIDRPAERVITDLGAARGFP